MLCTFLVWLFLRARKRFVRVKKMSLLAKLEETCGPEQGYWLWSRHNKVSQCTWYAPFAFSRYEVGLGVDYTRDKSSPGHSLHAVTLTVGPFAASLVREKG